MSPSNRLNDLKKQRRHDSGKKKRHTQQAQLVINQHSLQIIATAFSSGSKHDFQLFKDSLTTISEQISCLADSGYPGLANLHARSWLPKRKSKHRP
ncbi:MAG: transposase [Candidatus Poribacteria bacterium]